MSFFTRLSKRIYKRQVLEQTAGMNQDKLEFMLKSDDYVDQYGFNDYINDLLQDLDRLNTENSTNYNFNDSEQYLESSDGNTATIYSNSLTASQAPDDAMVTADYDTGSGSITFSISRDGGTNWTEATVDTLTDISSQPLGTTMIMKAVLTGDAKLYGWSLMWQSTSDGSTGGEVSLNQVTKLGVTTTAGSESDEPFTSSYDQFVGLVHSFVDRKTEPTVTSSDGVTTYTRGTDYEIDFANGRIKVLSTGTMADATSYLIDYDYIDPHEVVIEIPATQDFKRIPIEVLKFIEAGVAQENVVQTICAFDNADATDFEPNEMVEFDGTMHLKTIFSHEMTDEGMLFNYTSDLQNGTITFDTVKAGTDTVTADYIYFGGDGVTEYTVTGEILTTADNQTYNCANFPIKEGSLKIYVNTEEQKGGKLFSQTIDLSKYKTINSLEVV